MFEFDGDTSYFYLYRMDLGGGNKILDAIHISSGEPEYAELDLEIGWSDGESLVYLRIRGQTCAVFDCEGPQKYGGDYSPALPTTLPPKIRDRLLVE